ncbi:Gfo/Idh/MocA family oxidoreductase [Occultella glacieicola]|uniref:Gfo/Idh/MocA family oxidoreductase n=1 Tax=Occultella glacieicola TaxID=2518684 RepID=A0ABY2E3G5_9MICO|nr:Gfo/Idh/MocA family oxidoreductase [Occultella glacieicola]TDE92660.1 Gfo/Idh/MocA family oxidoreductase [Occultella glacieicola]
MSRPLRLGVLGAGARGQEAYGSWILAHPDRVELAAVADVREERALRFARAAGTNAAVFTDWRDLVCRLRDLDLDAAVVALPDQLHVDPAIALADAGVPMLLEKPAAPTSSELERLAAHCERTGARVAVGHVLRFTPFWRTVSELIGSPAFGRMLTLELRENIGFWHFAHSYVRGNWRRVATSSPMVLAKTCHDLDLIRWLAGRAPSTVYSIGSLTHFRAENAPDGAPEFCIDGCPAAAQCPFYAPRYYEDALAQTHGVPVTLLSEDTSPQGRRRALAVSDYGRCVYRSGNDVVDHQQTTLSFAGGLTANLTASAFTGRNTRDIAITGTRGQLVGNMETGRIELDLFAPDAEAPALTAGTVDGHHVRAPMGHRVWTIEARPEGADADDHRGHAGGDDGLMEAFVAALERGDLGRDPVLSLDAAMDSHRMAFAAESSRLLGKPVEFTGAAAAAEVAARTGGAA